jgi:hypothetical protein
MTALRAPTDSVCGTGDRLAARASIVRFVPERNPMKRLLVMSLPVAAVLAVLVVAAAASAHRDPCHRSGACPSDHHSYLWNGLYCTSYAAERLVTDRRTVVYDDRTYWCGSKQTGPAWKAPPARTATVATSIAVTPSEPITVSSSFHHPLPRSITVVTSGPVTDVRVRTSACYSGGEDVISTARDNRPGRLAAGYDHTATSCTIIATAQASSAKPGRSIKITLQIER